MIERTTDPAALVPRSAETSAPREPDTAQIDLSKMAEIAAPFFRQAHEQNIEEVRERSRARLELRRLELDHDSDAVKAASAARIAEATETAKVHTLEIGRRFWLAVVLGVGFLGVAVVLILRNEVTNAAFLLMGGMGIVTAVVNKTPPSPPMKTHDHT